MMRTAGGWSARGAEVGPDRHALVLEFDDLHRRVEMGTGLAVGPGAGIADPSFDVRYLTGETADGVVRLRLEVGASRGIVIAGLLEAVTFVLVTTADFFPDRNPFVLGGAFETRHGCLELFDVVDHREPASIEPAVGDDEGVLVGGEGKLECQIGVSWSG
jgi:hypothetical protein